MSTIYENGTYLGNNPTWHEEDSSWKAKQIIKIIKSNNIIPNTICEIGCGAGEILNIMSQVYEEKVMYFGYDISPNAYEICKKKSKHNLNFILKDLLEEKDVMFDVLMAIDVFEHIENYYNFLRNLRNKGVYKIFHIPLDMSVQAVMRGSPLMKARSSVGHIHYFTKETALAALKDTGYDILDYFYTSGSIELPNREWKAQLLRLPRKLLFSINQDLAVRYLGGFSLLVLAK